MYKYWREKKFMFVLPLSIFVLSALLISCKDDKKDLLGDLKLFETRQYEGEELSEERIAELRQAIAKYKEEVEKKVEATAQLGEHYKMLASEFLRRDMYGEALVYLQKALEYYPENEVIFYLCGACNARLGKAQVTDPVARDKYLEDAESYYLRAIELDNTFVQALYGLSVLYIFELDRVIDAEPYLLRILQKEKTNTKAMFLLARVYVYQDRIEDAIDVYDIIMEEGNSKEERDRARQNKEELLQDAYG